MKILLTGGTGFLGKQVLGRLLAQDTVETVYVVSRARRSHPSPKVHMIVGDLSHREIITQLPHDINSVVHLAGLYDFQASYDDNYMANVVATANICSYFRKLPKDNGAVFHHASTYVVGCGKWNAAEPEQDLDVLPPDNAAYAKTKAVAESQIRKLDQHVIYRLGILVGRRDNGYMEKIEGPYYILRLYRYLQKWHLANFLPMPLFAERQSYLPLVPIDQAADCLVSAIINPKTHLGKIYGVYNRNSIKLNDFIECLGNYRPTLAKPWFLKLPDTLLNWQQHLSQIPEDVFRFAKEVPQLDNSQFNAAFGKKAIAEFPSYKDKFFRGFEDYIGGNL